MGIAEPPRMWGLACSQKPSNEDGRKEGQPLQKLRITRTEVWATEGYNLGSSGHASAPLDPPLLSEEQAIGFSQRIWPTFLFTYINKSEREFTRLTHYKPPIPP